MNAIYQYWEQVANSITNIGNRACRRRTLEAAEIDVMERRVVVIPAEGWNAFEAWVVRLPQNIAALEELARSDPEWRR